MTSLDTISIHVCGGPAAGRSLTLPLGTWMVGRSPTTAVSLDDPRMAPYHASLTLRPDGFDATPAMGDVRVISRDRESMVCVVANSILRIERETRARPCVSATTPSSGRVRNRPPRTPLVALEPPLRIDQPARPIAPRPPQWSTMVAGVVVGLVVSVVAGQPLIALFGLTALLVAVITWLSARLSHRRAMNRWHGEVEEVERTNARAVSAHHRAEVLRLRARHPSLDRLHTIIGTGDDWFWAGRPGDDDAWRIAIGSTIDERRDDEGSSLLVPAVVDVGPGSIVGVVSSEAMRGIDTVRAMVLRAACRVGPSDLSVMFVGERPDELSDVRDLTHVTLEVSGDRHTVLVATSSDDVAVRHSPWRRLVREGRASLVVVAREHRSLPEDCTAIIDVDSTGTIVDSVSLEAAAPLVQGLASWTDPDAHDAVLPSRTRWTDLWDGWPADGTVPLSWIRRCASSGSRDAVAARLGWAADGRFDLDLVGDGPHAVVVGTTGSGKSELLRSLVLSLAAAHSPNDVQFVLIDFKGGAAFDACVRLPHVIGLLTDLDDDLGDRVVVGLRAELRRREHVLREAGVADVNDTDLPRLVIVVDELARLQADVPSFVSSLVDIAQRGRSLGVHLVVATQRGGQTLSADLLANSSIRIALRLQSRADSMDVVGVPDAHFLPRRSPGRSIVRVGQDDPVVFQCADTSLSLRQVVESVREAWIDHETPPTPWSTPLPTLVDFHTDSPNRFGLVDVAPGSAAYREEFVPNTSTDVVIEASRGRGKTNAAAGFARAWLISEPGGRVAVIAADPEAIRSLLPGGALLGVARFDEYEMVERILDGVEAGDRTLLVVDDADVWRAQTMSDRKLLALWERLERVVDRGSGSRIRMCLTVSRESGLPATVASRIPGAWRGIGECPGRFLVVVDGHSRAVQLARMPVVVAEGKSVGCLRTLPTFIAADEQPRSVVGVMSRRLEPLQVPVESMAAAGVFAVLGPRWSGRSWSLRRIADACREQGREVMAIDDADLVDVDASVIGRALRGEVLIVAGIDPATLRARPDHWLSVIRRIRSGLLLGRSARNDADLLGLFSVPESMVADAAGRGVWVDRGTVIDVVQMIEPFDAP
ncbi:MAG: hypothetical protein FGM29_09890 [Actinobacteria bacterium]|nr:hypothetical protein [Actinomycetota bacterium]